MVSKRWAWLAGFALLFAGLTNAHSYVHYCFDGKEPPATVHLIDGTYDHELPCHTDGTEHDDLDLDVPNQALAKVVKYDLPAIPVLTWTMALDAPPRGTLPDGVDSPPQPNPRYVLPQLRAPPR